MADMLISLALAVAAFTVSLRSFREKGFLLNNAWLFASAQERQTMDKRPHYRQSAVVFGLLGVMFLLLALGALLSARWPVYLAAAVAAGCVVYAAATSRASGGQ